VAKFQAQADRDEAIAAREVSGGQASSAEAPKAEIDELKAQLDAMQQRIERLARDRD
jgi:ubiquinone biosynthesis protein UbiJ